MNIDVVKLKRRAGACVRSSREAYAFGRDIQDAAREVMTVLLLNAKNAVIDYHTHSVGTVDSSAVYPREIIKAALLNDASSLVLLHNHPSGDPEPSLCDKEITRDMVQACRVMGLKVLDHVIIGDGMYFSFADQGLIEEYELAPGGLHD